MSGAGTSEASRIIADLDRGDGDAADRLLPLVYEELRSLAAGYFRRQPASHTLQPTALVHEAFLKMAGPDGAGYRGRGHFMAVAATAMRQILIDRARRRGAAKHGGERRRLTLHENIGGDEEREIDLLALDDALHRLAALDERKSRIIELRFFGGASIEETAEALGIARSTVTEDWRMARAWLVSELRSDIE